MSKMNIQKRGDSFLLTVSAGIGSNGKRLRYTKTVKVATEKEAEKEWILFAAEVTKGTLMDSSKLTFKDLSDMWWKEYALKNLAPKTLERYRILLDSRILKALGHLKLEMIKPLHLIKFYNNLDENGIRNNKVIVNGKKVRASGGLSGQTKLHHHRLIHCIFNSAYQWGLIATNPASKVPAPKVIKKNIMCYDIEQAEKLVNALIKEPIKYQASIYIALYGGLRAGEIAGLEWHDIDFEKNTITIHQSRQFQNKVGTFTKSPKNFSSNRTITMPVKCMNILKKYKLWQVEERFKYGDKWYDKDNNDKIFVRWDIQNAGEPLPPTELSNQLRRIIDRHNLDKITMHQLRHTHASILISQGVDIQTVAKRLGHSSSRTTLEVYSHFLKSADVNAANKLETIFEKKPEKADKKDA